MSRRTFFLRVLLVAAAAAIALNVLIVLEFALSHVRVLQAVQQPTPLYEVNGPQLGDYLPLQDGLSRWVVTRPFRYTTNAEGFRYSPLDYAPQREGPRILCLGDSFTFGSFVNDDQSFPSVMARRLFNPGHFTGQVINAGFAGYSIADELEYYVAKGRRLKPNLVVLSIYLGNDVRTAAQPGFRQAVAATPLLDRLKLQLSRYALYNGLVYARLRLMVALGYLRRGPDVDVEFLGSAERAATRPAKPEEAAPVSDPEVERAWSAFADTVRKVVATIQRDDVPLLIVAFPHRSQLNQPTSGAFQQRLTTLCGELGVPCLDLLPRMREEQARGVFTLYNTVGDDHPTPAGHELVATEVLHVLVTDPRFALMPDATPGWGQLMKRETGSSDGRSAPSSSQ